MKRELSEETYHPLCVKGITGMLNFLFLSINKTFVYTGCCLNGSIDKKTGRKNDVI